jgi:hypothetical protein
MSPDTNGWSRAEMHVFSELERLSNEIGELRRTVGGLTAQLSVVDTAFRHHAMIFGLIGGSVASLLGGVILAVILK